MSKTLLVLSSFLVISILPAANLSDNDYAAMRTAARNRPRKVIFNNDGCDALYYPLKREVTRQKFLDLRTSYLPGVVDTIMYCPISAGPGHMTIKLKHGNLLTVSPNAKVRNIAGELDARNVDLFEWVVDFTRKNKMEIFFSFRMNDIHDWRHTKAKPNFLFSPIKDQHRDWLFSQDRSTNPPFGWWSALDFDIPEVRQLQLNLVKDALDKYDVDGIDLDFSRYLRAFKNSAYGIEVTDKQRNKMTSLIRDIRHAIDARGKLRGHAILLSIVLPDDVQYCRAMGYDIETWFKEKLIDIWQLPDSFRLNPYAVSVKLAKRYGVKLYPHAGNPWPYEGRERKTWLSRRNAPGYHARDLNIFSSGADGIYIYNIGRKREVDNFIKSDLNFLTAADKRYFITGGAWEIPFGYVLDSDKCGKLRILTELVPVWVSPNVKEKFLLEIGDDLNKLRQKKELLSVIAYADRNAGPSGALEISSGGITWPRSASLGRYESFIVPEKALKKGLNELTLTVKSPMPGNGKMIQAFSGKKLKDFQRNLYRSTTKNALQDKGDAIRINDRSSAPGDAAVIAKALTCDQFGVMEYHFEAALVYSNNDMAAATRLTNGRDSVIMALTNGKVKLLGTSFEYKIDTKKFNKYKLTLGQNNLALKINGEKVYNGALPTRRIAMMSPLPESRFSPVFASIIAGSFSGPGQGESLWRNLVIGAPGGSVKLTNFAVDIMLRANHPKLNHNGKFLTQKDFGDNGKVLQKPLMFKTDKAGSMPAELVLLPGDQPILFVVSDGKKASAWEISRKGVAFANGRSGVLDLADGKKHTYTVAVKNDRHVLYKDNILLKSCRKDGRHSRLRGVWIGHPDDPTISEFLNIHGRLLSPKEKKLVKSGGVIVKPVSGSAGNEDTVKIYTLKFGTKKGK